MFNVIDRQEVFETSVELVQELAYWLGTDNAQSIACELSKTMPLVHVDDVQDVVKAFRRETYVQTYLDSEFKRYAEKLVDFDSAVTGIVKANSLPSFLVETLQDWEGTYEDWFVGYQEWDSPSHDDDLDDYRLARR